ncbi:alcohol dehydrogenase catalytic domain-containing protein [Paenibacillus melissococcoides]|uniref:Alcohol dehydrogenase catalytic domain-containing protein n=1 Tax=Paenibacillus melissococcoides TaxID=2912268 RepID=A0ABN8U438_9BACL|nr:alcohol dehydrogenase catalytic domain-containing protein [Paenibacillus melissococcoides]CAH8245015.1 alcohol dehydrogenase catalytic domain-containing protein [Paenibacillus melissococcoides]CAH8709649.1 alcohol dehydrogenase catalytic domain-containing protein [Paenibacillus melissococcoides]CAH8710375.1 alcohol dehydrogenase catalytic domain-containing protein [Paenibacillus melissococcoides]
MTYAKNMLACHVEPDLQLTWKEMEAPPWDEGELLVRVHATALNRADLLQKRGNYPVPEGASPVLGLEMAGTVEAVGPGVTGWKAGDRVRRCFREEAMPSMRSSRPIWPCPSRRLSPWNRRRRCRRLI